MKAYLHMKHLPWKLFTSAIVIAIVFDILFYKAGGAGLNIFLFQIVLIGGSLAIAHYLEHHVPLRSWIAAGFSILFAFTFVIWTSEIGLTLSAIGLVGSTGLFALYLLGHHGKFHHPVNIAIEGLHHGMQIVITRMSIFGQLRIPRVAPRNSAVLRGVLISIPILIIFFTLFLDSDLVLQQKASGFTEWLNNILGQDVVAQLFIIGSIAFVVTLFFAAAFWKRFEFQGISQLVSRHVTEIVVVLSGVNLLFLAFIAFQSVYLFGGQAAWDKIEGISYSEYAVQGFNELATVTILVILLLLSLRYFHTERVHRKIVIWAELFLIAETIAIVVSAWVRMSLYVEQYNFTTARLFGFWFFITATVLFGMLAIHVYKEVAQYKFMQQGLLFLGAAMLVFTMSAPDALSVRLNIGRAVDGQIDAFPLFKHLSAEAYPLMANILTNEEFDIGLIPIEGYCADAAPSYNSDPRYNGDGQLKYIDYLRGSNSQKDRNLRSDLEWFNDHWRRKHFKFVREEPVDGKGRSITKEVVRHDWRSWNLSRVNIPRNEDGTLSTNFAQENYTIKQVAEACNIPMIDPDFIPLSTPPVDAQ